MQLFVDVPPAQARLFGLDRHWIRLSQDGGIGPERWSPEVHGLYPNAIPADQAKTVRQEILGSSLGQPGTVVVLSETPVLPDSVELRVREELAEEEEQALADEYRRLRAERGDEGSDPEVTATLDELNVPGTWVLWRRVDSFVDRDGDARVYLLDPQSGRITFGDGKKGKIPPAGPDAIRAFRYQSSLGELGNLEAWSEMGLKTPFEGVDAVVLPVPSAGGLDAPGPEVAIDVASNRLRHADRALTPADVEAIAVDSSPTIVRARCLPPREPSDPIRLVVARRDEARCPTVSLADREAIARQLLRHGWGGLHEEMIEVQSPTYVPIRVAVSILAPGDRVAEVEHEAEATLVALLHPTTGGPDGAGWPFGRAIRPSDIVLALAEVDGIDRVTDVAVTRVDDGRDLDRLPLLGLACAEEADIDVDIAPEED